MNWIAEYYSQKHQSFGKWIQLLLEKILGELERGESVLDEDKADKVINWIEAHCFHTEGPLAPQNIKLEIWQKAFLSALYGIVDSDGKRKYREAVLIVARKNGKTLLASAIAKYEWFEGGYGSRIFCTAPKLDQADLVYNSVWTMTTLDPDYIELKDKVASGIKYHERKTVDDSELPKHRMSDLYISKQNSTVKKVAFSEKKSDGYNPSLVICDEIAAWQGDAGLKQYEVFKSAGGARDMGDNPMILLSCSTSGYINDSIYDELIKRSTRFLLGESRETRLLPFLYMIDDIEKWDDITELEKSNPNLGVSVSPDYLNEEIAISKGSLSKKAEFLTKYCNLKQNSSLAWLPADAVERASGDALSLEDFKNCYCVVGVDLSRTTDLTAVTAIIEKDGKLHIFARFFMPAEKIDEASARDNLPYRIYVQRGLLIPSGDNFVDYHDCMKWIMDLLSAYKIYPLKIMYDRYCANYLIQDLKAAGFQCDDCYQGENMTPGIREFEGLIKNGTVLIGDNDLLKVHLLNAALKMNNETERVKLVKLNPTAHVDGVAAILDAMIGRQKWWNEIGLQLQNARK